MQLVCFVVHTSEIRPDLRPHNSQPASANASQLQPAFGKCEAIAIIEPISDLWDLSSVKSPQQGRTDTLMHSGSLSVQPSPRFAV